MLDVGLMVDLVPDSIYLRSGQSPEATALVLPNSTGRITYGKLSDRAARVGGGLASLGIGRGDRVAILARSPLPILEILFGCARVDAILVPIDPRLGEMDISLVAADVSPSVLFYERAFVAQAWVAADSSDCIIVALDSDNGDRSQYERLLTADPSPPIPVASDHPWVILYRGREDGVPVKSILSHGAILSDAIHACISWASRPNGAPPLIAPLFHSGRFDVCTLAHLLYGPNSQPPIT